MSQKGYVDRSYKAREKRSKSSTNTQNFFRAFSSDTSRKYMFRGGIVFLIALNVTATYAAMFWEMPETHPFYNLMNNDNKKKS